MPKYLIFLVLLISISGFSQEPGYKNYTTLDGLPSGEVYKSLIDQKGYLWFATNSGVCYFNGEKFTTLDMSHGLIENTILELKEDERGRIWFVGLSGSLCYYEEGKIKAFKYNNIIKSAKHAGDLVASGCFEPVSPTEVKMTFNRGRSLHIKDSTFLELDFQKGDTITLKHRGNQYSLSFYFQKGKKKTLVTASFNDSTHVEFEIKNTKSLVNILSRDLCLEFDDHILFMTRFSSYAIYKSGKVVETPLKFQPIFMIKGIWGGIWIGTSDGMLFYRDHDLSKKPRLHILRDRFITSMRYDQNSRGWVTTLNNGVFYVQSLYVTNYYAKHLSENQITNIIELDNGDFVSFSKKGHVFLIKKNLESLEVFPMEVFNKQMVYQVKKYHDDLFVATTDNLYRIPQSYFSSKPEDRKKFRIDSLEKNNIKDFIIKDSVIWVTASNGLFYFPDYFRNSSKDCFPVKNNPKSRISKIIAYDNQNLDTNYSYLLFQDVNYLWRMRYPRHDPHNPSFSQYEASGTEFESVTLANDFKIKNDVIYLATRGSGLICIHDDTLLKYDQADGLLSNYIKKIDFDDSNQLLLGTNKGLNILELDSSRYPKIKSVEAFTVNDGLRGNDVFDLVSFKDHILCGTNFGLSLINVPVVSGMKDEFQIHIDEFMVNGKNVLEKAKNHYSLKSNENNISIRFDALDLHDKKGLKYYYQLLGSDQNDWKEIGEPQVVFPMMAAGEYQFIVKARNSYGFWSKGSDSVFFTIPKPFYKTWLFRIAVLLGFAGMIFLVLKEHYSRKNELLSAEKKLAIYQQQSLTRVINPHFLMNVFNSINSNLFNKKPMIAMAYVKDVGNLVKQIFNSSYYDSISILEEVKLLESYLKIEKRRSKNAFQSIILNNGLDDFTIPSLMIQIFVENAVNHAFVDVMNRKALVSVVFKKKGHFIVCEVTDNGIGLSKSAKIEKVEPHRPRKHGMDIIKERLHLLNSFVGKEKYQLLVQEIKSQYKNEIIGTKVEIWFPIFRQNDK